MTKSEAIKDLEYLKSLAEAGEHTPLVGGPIGLMWGVLLSATFMMQYLIMSQILAWPAFTLGLLWLSFAVIGGVGCFLLGRKAGEKPGANSAANRVESYVWYMFSMMMLSLFIGIILKMALGDGSVTLYDIMVIVGFAGQGAAYGVVALMAKLNWLKLAAIAGFVMSAVSFVAMGETHLYLIAAIGSVFTIILPSLKTLGAERANG